MYLISGSYTFSCVISCIVVCVISGIVVCLIARGKKADRVESIYSKGCNMTQGWSDSSGHDDNDNASKQKTPWRVLIVVCDHDHNHE